MGHSVNFIVGKDKKEIIVGAQEFAFHEVDRYENPFGTYHGNLKFSDKTFNSEDEALEYLDTFVGWYNDVAVRYKDVDSVAKTKKQVSIEEKLEKLTQQTKAISIHARKSKTMTCPHCGKKHTISNVKGEKCPNCKSDLRSATQLHSVAVIENKMNLLKKELKELNNKRSKKAKTLWIAKVEVHC